MNGEIVKLRQTPKAIITKLYLQKCNGSDYHLKNSNNMMDLLTQQLNKMGKHASKLQFQ